MADNTNYSTIDRAYDDFLNREVDSGSQLPGVMSEDVGATSSGGAETAQDPGGTENAQTSNDEIASGTVLANLFLDNWMKSKFYIPKKQGFILDAQRGYIECMELYVGAGGIVGGSMDIPNKTAIGSWHVDNSGNMWSGDPTFASAPFRVTNDGIVRVGASPSIFIDGPNLRIRTSTYASGLQGFTIEADGSAEFNNITARGEFHSQILAFDEVHGSAGTQIWVKSGGKLLNDATSVTTPTTFNIDIEDPDTGHPTVSPAVNVGAIFVVGDILRIKDGSGNDNWMTITARSDETTFWRYTCTKDSGTNGTFRAGAAVLDYGQSGQGAVKITVDETNAPFLDIFTHAGSPWSAFTERVRLGNLAGLTDPISGAALSGYGLWTDNVYLTGFLKADGVILSPGTGATNGGYLRLGQTGYDLGNGFWFGDEFGVAKLSIGDSSTGLGLTWDGTSLTVNGSAYLNDKDFGNGFDGDATLTYDTLNLKRDTYFENLSISNGSIINLNGYALFVNGLLTMASFCQIRSNGDDGNNGGDAVGETPGVGGSSGTGITSNRYYGSLDGVAGTAGGQGSTTANGASSYAGTNGTAITSSVTSVDGRDGSKGGDAPLGGGTGVAGAAGSFGGVTPSKRYPYNFSDAFELMDRDGSFNFSFMTNVGHSGGSTGGAGSGGDGSNSGGGGGGGGGNGSDGGFAFVAARRVSRSGGIISVNGGDGGNGGNGGNGDAAGNTYGGSGGGGGVGGNGGLIVFVYQISTAVNYLEASPGTGGTAGTGGTGFGFGSSGSSGIVGQNGKDGKIVIFKI